MHVLDSARTDMVRCQTKGLNVDWEGHPEFVEGVGKPTNIFRQDQYDYTRFGFVSSSGVENMHITI